MTRQRQECAWLRILATSDVHAHLRGFDYARNEEMAGWGLTRLATRIAQARADAPACVLFDNGDILQGTPLAHLYSDPTFTDVHPVLAAMEALDYDAIGLGNHEFNFGLDRLHDVMSSTKIPVLCANLLTRKGADLQDDAGLYPATTLLRRMIPDPKTDEIVEVRIGVLSVVPSQVMKWDGAHLKGRLETRDMVESAAFHVTRLREDGADIVILLAHTGIDPDASHREAENAAVALAQIPGVDAMITGHTHSVFPDPCVSGEGIDADAGTIFGVPTVMPGYRGSHLGMIDLFLQRREDGWRVQSHDSVAVPVANAAEDPTIARIVDPAHQATLAYVNQPVGHTSRPIHSYLSHVRDDLSTRIVAEAQRTVIQDRLTVTAHANLPLLSASAPYQTGGRAGPLAYTDIPAGPLKLRDANSLYPFPNALCAVLVNGAEVQDWLERSASGFCQLHPGQQGQPLLNPEFPGHAMDTIYGLSYEIDLNVPPLYDEHGERLQPSGAVSRICQLSYQGAPVRPKDRFVIAVSGYRAYGGGPYAAFPPERILVQTEACALQSVSDFLRSNGADRVGEDPCWRFVPMVDTSAVFETGPGILKYHRDVAQFGLCEDRMNTDGFVRLCMSFDRRACESAA